MWNGRLVDAPRQPLLTAEECVKGELQQAPMIDNTTGLAYETNMAAFEAQDPSRRPARANVGYSSVKASFRR